MNAVETMVREHVLIRRFVDCLSLAGGQIERGQHPPLELFEKGVVFARRFADAFHHFKEEQVMFARLAEKQEGRIDDQIDTLRFQHERGRNLVSKIAGFLEGYGARDAEAIAQMLESVAAYVALLRHHIHLEDHVFFPMAERELMPPELEEIERVFDQERDRQGADTFAECEELVAEMCRLLERRGAG